MQSRKLSGIFLLGIRELFQNSIPRWEGDKVRETCRQHHDLALAIVTYSSTTTLYVAGSARGILGDISADADDGNDTTATRRPQVLMFHPNLRGLTY
jgi:hypothetical protein